jgi:hypothetical protein
MGAVLVVIFFVGLVVWIITSANKKAYPNEPMPCQGAGIQSRPSSGKLSPKQLADIAGEKIAKSFSAAMFRQLFGGVKLAEGWTMDDAFAEWCSLGNLALVIATWSVFSGDKGLYIIDCGRKALVKQWRLSEDQFSKLRAIVNETEAAAVTAYGTCKDGTGLSQFFGGYANRIVGSKVPIGMSHIEAILSGYKDRVTDPITISVLARLFIETCIAAKTLLEDANIDWTDAAGPSSTSVIGNPATVSVATPMQTEMAELKSRAAQGDPAAQVALGNAYRSGKGVQQSKSEALRWFRAAAEQGWPEGQRHVGYMYDCGEGVHKSRSEAVTWFRRAADLGDSDAQVLLATMLREGDGVRKDCAEAVRWYSRLADHGNVIGQYRLGQAYRTGEGIPADKSEAAEWFQKAAKQGLMEAQRILGLMYENGEGVAKDLPIAAYWLEQATVQGDRLASRELNILMKIEIQPRADRG